MNRGLIVAAEFRIGTGRQRWTYVDWGSYCTVTATLPDAEGTRVARWRYDPERAALLAVNDLALKLFPGAGMFKLP
jgi:hypothetical protein